MSPLNSVTLLVNSLTLIMALGFLIIILWHDREKDTNQFFAFFLFAVTTWSMGVLLFGIASLVLDNPTLTLIAGRVLELGFVSSTITAYGLVAVLVSIRLPRFRLVLIASLVIVTLYQILIAERPALGADTISSFTLSRFNVILSLLFGLTALNLIWRYRARLASTSLRVGLIGFFVGQAMGLLNPDLGTFSASIMLSSISVLVLGFAILHGEIILPLRERTSQVEAMHSMSLAITSQLSMDVVMDQIAKQAGNWLQADGVGIYLREDNRVRLSAVNGLPDRFVGLSMPMSVGVAGRVVHTQQSVQLKNYAMDWQGEPDLPLAKDTFGAVICVPLIAMGESVGALMVVASRHGRSFQPNDVDLLEMLGAQAAVAIIHSRLFSNQKRLTEDFEKARNQLKTVLTSTENPVIAVNRQLEVIFANKAAERLFPMLRYISQPLTEVLPADVLPEDYLTIYRDIRQNRAHIYELVHNERIYLCHLAALGEHDRIEGWVAVLNDVTQLKELDRLKSEMVRMTSHDLKNPLQAAMANIDLLEDSLENHPDDDVHYSVRSIEKQLNRMYRIISGVLDMERLRTGAMTLQTCYPRRILQLVVDDWRDHASEGDIHLRLDMEEDVPNFQGDPGQIERALSNLIENAIKFTDTGGTTVDIWLYMEAESVIFKISDDGIGIPDEDQLHVFDSFFRANQQGAEHITGTGLGLHLVKTVIEGHHGKVWLESETGTGTTFYVSIPVIMSDVVST